MLKLAIKKYISLKENIESFKEILSGKYDDLPEEAFLYVGTIKDVVEKSKNKQIEEKLTLKDVGDYND